MKELVQQMEAALRDVPAEITLYRVAVIGNSPRLLRAAYCRCFEGVSLVWRATRDPFAKIKAAPPNWPHYFTGFSGECYRIASTPEAAWKLFLDAHNSEAADLVNRLHNTERHIRLANSRSRLQLAGSVAAGVSAGEGARNAD